MSDDKITISQRIKRRGEASSLVIVIGAFLLVGGIFFFGGIGTSLPNLETAISANADTID